MNFSREEYRFVPWRQTPEDNGYEPALPEGTYCELLAEIGFGHVSGRPGDALYLVRWPEDEPEPPGTRSVSKELEKLLSSGRAYPPALAIARAVRFQKESSHWLEAEAVEKFTTVLRTELDRQRDRPFFLAKALGDNDDSFYKTSGEYYWILDYTPAKKEPLWWVSGDYFVYTAPVTDFEVDVSWLIERFRGNFAS